jgi:hypothetical protein
VAWNGKVRGELEIIKKEASHHLLGGPEGKHRKPTPGVHIRLKFDLGNYRIKALPLKQSVRCDAV